MAWWRYQMEKKSTGFLWGKTSVNGGFSPHKGRRRGALLFSFMCAWTNGWANDEDAGDLRRHRVHYGVTVMKRVSVEAFDQLMHESVSWDISLIWEMARRLIDAWSLPEPRTTNCEPDPNNNRWGNLNKIIKCDINKYN